MRPMVTSTPRISNGQASLSNNPGFGGLGNNPGFNILTPGHMDQNDRRQTYNVLPGLPSTVKKPQLEIHTHKIEEIVEEEEVEKDIIKEDLETLKEPENDTTVKKLSNIKEEETTSGSNIPTETDIEQLLQISDIDLSLSPEKIKKEDISGLDMIVDQTMSAPPKIVTSCAKLQLSGGSTHEDESVTKDNVSSGTFVKEPEMELPKETEVDNISSGTFVKDDDHRVSLE